MTPNMFCFSAVSDSGVATHNALRDASRFLGMGACLVVAITVDGRVGEQLHNTTLPEVQPGKAW